MNWLAHVFLSEQQIDHQLGNFLADFLKHKPWLDASSEFRAGLQMHMNIDSYTDSHPLFLTSKSRFGKQGHLKGVVVDLTYDLLLTKHWNTYSNIELNDFLDNFYRNAIKASEGFPDHAKGFVRQLIHADHLRHYQSLDHLQQTFKRVDKRLSERVLKKECTSDYLPTVTAQLKKMEQDFLGFFPDLLDHVRSRSNQDNLNHWR
jgi:acyl carrier protein phosphodiesterase